jgi:hypothetical protein
MSIELFLQPSEPVEKVVEVFVTDRFKHPDGKPVLWKIRSLSQVEFDRCAKKSTEDLRDGKRLIDRRVDYHKVLRYALATAVVYPDLNNRDLLDHYKVPSWEPADLLRKMLTQGEYSRLVEAYDKLNDTHTSNRQTEEDEDFVDAIKN